MVISPPIQLGTIGMDDTLVLMVLALVLLGPRRLPQVGRQIGKLMYEFRKASNDFKYQLEEELRNAEDADKRKREEAERQKTLADAQSAVVQAQSAAEKALAAAAQAQNAAQAAQSAAVESTAAAVESTAAAEESTAAAELVIAEAAAPDMIYSFGSSETETAETRAIETEPALAEPQPPGAAEAGETALRIQPPTTGEQVAAERPGRGAAEPQAAACDSPAVSGEETLLKKDVAAEEPPAATEPTTHHG